MELDFDRKFEEMNKYIPSLENMIRRLENTNNTGSGINPRQAKISNIRALKDLLLDKNKKRMKMKNLLKFEQVLVNLVAKFETRETLPGSQKGPQSVSPKRQKNNPPKNLKNITIKAASVQEKEEMLPEIARANQTKEDCTPASKELALFQQRPNKACHPSSSKCSHSRVLVSPPASNQRWNTTKDQIAADNHLFHRTSPKKSPNKKDLNMSSKHDRKRTRRDREIESVNLLNKDISDKIINCDNTDVDIGTLRDLRNQILNELKQTRTNEDISDIKQKCYLSKRNKSQKKPDVKEGECEVIENVYGSLAKANGDHQSGKCKENTTSTNYSDRDVESREVQVHLVASNCYKENTIENPLSSKVTENSKTLLNDSNKSSFQLEKDQFKAINQVINISSDNFNSSTEKKLITPYDDLIPDKAQSVTVSKSPRTSYFVSSCLIKDETSDRRDKYQQSRDPRLIKEDGPMTPVHLFGRSDNPPTTPSHPVSNGKSPSTPSQFRRFDMSITPSHPFGRSDCPNTLIQPLVHTDSPTIPSHNFITPCERSITRTMPSKQNLTYSFARPSSSNRTNHEMLADNTVSFESHDGHVITLDTRINATFHGFNFEDDAIDNHTTSTNQTGSEISPHMINQRIVNEKIENVSPVVVQPNQASQAKEMMLPLPKASKEHNLQTVSTSIPENNNSQKPVEIIEQSRVTELFANKNSEACPTPDSTINSEDNISQPKSFLEIPDSTISAQSEINPDISSTYDDQTSSLGEAIAPKLNSLDSILSLLSDKSKMKELLSMLDDQSNNEKLKNKLEKLSKIVSEDEESSEKSIFVGKKTSRDKVQLISKSETIPINSQQEKPKDEKQSESVNINKPEDSLEIQKKLGENDQSKIKVDETNGHENRTSNYDNDNVSSSNDEKDNQRSQSCMGKNVIGKGRNARWGKIFNKLEYESDEERVTGSKSIAPQAKPLKKKNELQLLQEDLNDMFIRDDVLNATGIRTCRLAKLVGEKNKSQSNECSPTITHESGIRRVADLRDKTDPGPFVVLEKFSTKKLSLYLKPTSPKLLRKKLIQKPTPKSTQENPPVTKTTEKPKSLRAYRPGPKSKKVPNSQLSVKTNENTSLNSDSENGFLNSLKCFESTELLAEKKPRGKKRQIKWQMGVIKSKKTKQKTNKPSPRPPLKRHPAPEPIVGVPIQRFPDMDCFTDKTYCFVNGSSTYPCRLCRFEGQSIVQHYKKHHPHFEIPLSRLQSCTALAAIKQSITTNFQDISKATVAKYVCRFCMMIFDDKEKALKDFFWHVVRAHTGEYKQLCSECLNMQKCKFTLDIPPPPKDLKGLLMGYLCGKCNYTQVSLENLKYHVSLRHNDEETEVFAISLGMITQKMVETLKMLATQESPRTTKSICLIGSSITDDKSVPEVQRKPRLRGPTSFQSKIQFEYEASNDEHQDSKLVEKSEIEAEETKKTEHLVSTFKFHDHNMKSDPEPDDATLEIAACDMKNSALTTLESIQHNSLDVESRFKINYTGTGKKEYLCCINGDAHYRTSLLISMKKHLQTKHTFDLWDGYCSVCKVFVMSEGIHELKDCLAHFLDKHLDNFPVLNKTPKVEVTASAEHVRTENIQFRPKSELISNQSQFDITKTQQEDPSNPSILEQPQGNPIADINDYKSKEIEGNYEETQNEVMSKKHKKVLDTMMIPNKLAHVFKCAGRYCSFTCASTEDALVHASTHQRVGGEDALICSYCSFDAAGNAIDLVSHVFKEHGACQFCCKACFYRAITSSLVEAHYIRMHGVISPGVVLQATIITSLLKKADESDGLLSYQKAVKHYVCWSDGCWFKTLTSEKFVEHLSQMHPDIQSHNCYECPYIATSTIDLVQHLQSHGLKLYQCTWCVFGADTENEMLGHASVKHPMKRPQAYLRHVIETKVGSSTAQLPVLPIVQITKKTAIAPVKVLLGVKPDNPDREVERSLALEKLICQTDLMIQNFNFETTSSPIQMRVTVLEEEELIDSESFSSATWLKDQPTEQMETICEPLRLDAPTPIDNKLPVSERATQQLKEEETLTNDNKVIATESRISNAIYCIDSDEEDSNVKAGVIDLTDDNYSNIGPPLPIDKNTTTNKGPTQRFPWLQLFKCSKCNTIFKTGHDLNQHYQCCFPYSFDVVWCPYCPYKTEDKNNMINHYTNQHGQLDRYTCGICKHEDTSSKLIRKHYRTVHGLNKLEFKIQYKSSHSIEYLVDAANDSSKTKGSRNRSKTRCRRKRSNKDPPINAPPAKLRCYGPGNVSLLPMNQIFDELAQCSLCEFSTKVRHNLIRHLQSHSEQQSVPQIAPVNPVPHLETNKMHFDRILNLASSSIANKTTEKSSRSESEPVVAVHISPQAAARYPKYIPKRQRYACGAKDCYHISNDEAMLKSHWDTLHSGSNDYHCVHCPANQQIDTSRPLTAARIIVHLKMHDARLFACSSCPYYHHQQHILDKHLFEKHNGNAQVKVVRGPSTTLPPLVSTQPTANASSMDLKPWQCGLCKFKSMLRPEVVEHCSKQHQSKFQYKCAFCPWRSTTLENVTKHHSNSHSKQQADVFYFYYEEGSISDEPDGTPRWMKQRLKAGLPVEHEVKTKTDPPASEASAVSTLIAIQKSPSVLVDSNTLKSELPDPESRKQAGGPIKDLCIKFGNFCDPNGIRYKCSLCKQTMEDTREAMQSHLYEELKYRKWGCSVCSYRAFHKKGLKEHAFYEHRKNLYPMEMSSDEQIETWVTELLDHQEKIIKNNLTNFRNQKIVMPQKKQLSTSQPQEKEKESTTTITEESLNINKQELAKQLGPFGEPKYLMFCCPKCDVSIKGESKMNEHLEMELSKVRWSCSNCRAKFQHYHQAQLHCRTVHVGQSAKPAEAVRDPKIRSAWIETVIQVQKLGMYKIPITSKPSLSTEKEPDQEPAENSLLVVRYEENVPNPETTKPQELTRRKRPGFMSDSDSDDDDEDERLVIDE